MARIADIYVRVSTDEQAEKGYSQRNQEEVLRKYCNINSIEIRNVIFEDHSAKTFNRPEWKKLILNLKKHKNKIDLVLFTKWDRFSRNAGDAYQMINILRKLGVEPQAIEQPLDLSIPENKMMLAFYLAAPEVENDRRALNVFHGMRRARKEGRYMGLAPLGYENKSREDGSKYISPNDSEAAILKWSFEELSRGIFNTEQVYKMAYKKGLKCSKSKFWVAMRNPLYCGKIFIPTYKDEEARFVKGQHEPIISEGLFYNVQEVLDGRGRTYRPKIQTTTPFPLRGFLVCPVCGKTLTASRSKGRIKYYSYYHCTGDCKFRANSDTVNDAFDNKIEKYIPKREFLNLYAYVIMEQYSKRTSGVYNEKRQLLSRIKDYENRLSRARDLLAKGEIETSDYREMKSDYTSKIEVLERKLSEMGNETLDVEGLLNEGIERLLNLKHTCKCEEMDDRFGELRDLIGSIFRIRLKYCGIYCLGIKFS